jgi:hypothetical protein
MLLQSLSKGGRRHTHLLGYGPWLVANCGKYITGGPLLLIDARESLLPQEDLILQLPDNGLGELSFYVGLCVLAVKTSLRIRFHWF